MSNRPGTGGSSGSAGGQEPGVGPASKDTKTSNTRILDPVSSPSVQPGVSPINSPVDLGSYSFTFEHTLHSSTYSANIEADLNPSPPETTWDDHSITSSISRFRVENGRTYHGFRDGSYHFPNDEMEIARLEWQYYCLKTLLGQKNYFAPWTQENPPKRVLELGTGTGIWALEMAEEFPNAEVIGTDLSPVQPAFVPENLQFFIEDALDEKNWEWPNPFDHIHVRMTLGCWANFEHDIARRSYANLRPGGWFEAQELLPSMHCDDGTMPVDWPMKLLFDDLEDCSRLLLRSLRLAEELREGLINAGFVDVEERTYKLPINNWPKSRKWKEFGAMWHAAFEYGGLQSFAMALLTRVRGLKKEQVEVHLIQARRALRDTNVHAYQKFFVVTGRKPYPGEVITSTPQGPASTGASSSSPKSTQAPQISSGIEPLEDDIPMTH